MKNEKSDLILERNTLTVQKPTEEKKIQESSYNQFKPIKVIHEPSQSVMEVGKVQTICLSDKLGVGKAKSTKSIKVPAVIHNEINLLGSFMDENKMYVILQKLIDSYVKNELTNRQQRQFEFMIDDTFTKDK